jgi:hypothetical protein
MMLHQSCCKPGKQAAIIEGEGHPAIFPENDCFTDGIIYSNISAISWERLDGSFSKTRQTPANTQLSRLFRNTSKNQC